jgi:hypothetical protein
MSIATVLFFEIVILIAVAGIGALIVAFSIRNGEIFELLVHGIGLFAFYRCFKVRSEENIEKELAEYQASLNALLKWRDEILASLDIKEYRYYAGKDAKRSRESLAERELEILEYRRKLDYRIAIAYLAGFGKVARKFAK